MTDMSSALDIFVDDWDRPPAFQLEEERLASGALVLIAAGELDLATAPVLRNRLDAAVDACAKRVVLDLTAVSFIDSVAMAAIIHARTRLGDAGRLAVVIPSGSYTRLVLEIAGLPRCLDLFETREQALLS
jgi:anti-sigma B factor antagonist